MIVICHGVMRALIDRHSETRLYVVNENDQGGGSLGAVARLDQGPLIGPRTF